MTKREAKQFACAFGAALLRGFSDSDSVLDDSSGPRALEDVERIQDACEELAKELDRRSGDLSRYTNEE